MRTIPLHAARGGWLRSKRLVALLGDERLVEQVKRGDDLAFEVVFERHGAAILSFCRHLLGSREEAEDAVQHTFGAAYRELRRGERAIRLRPWLFTIARNRCLSILRSRREQPQAEAEVATAGLAEEVERRADLRDLLADLGDLDEVQRSALLMSELSGLTHAEIASVLGCRPQRVKALVFRARSGLIDRREAREAPCERIREQLANLRGGSLRRSELRYHLRVCAGCREYREQVKRQRGLLAAALPVAPTLGLKQSVLAAIGIGGSAGGGAAAAGGGGAMIAKVATACVLAGGGAVAGERAIDGGKPDAGPPAAAQAETREGAANAADAAGPRAGRRGDRPAPRMHDDARSPTREPRPPETPASAPEPTASRPVADHGPEVEARGQGKPKQRPPTPRRKPRKVEPPESPQPQPVAAPPPPQPAPEDDDDGDEDDDDEDEDDDESRGPATPTLTESEEEDD